MPSTDGFVAHDLVAQAHALCPSYAPLLNQMPVADDLRGLAPDAARAEAQQTWRAVTSFDTHGPYLIAERLDMRNPIATLGATYQTQPPEEQARVGDAPRMAYLRQRALGQLMGHEEQWLLTMHADAAPEGATAWDGLIAQIEYGVAHSDAMVSNIWDCQSLRDPVETWLVEQLGDWLSAAYSATGADPDVLVCHPARYRQVQVAYANEQTRFRSLSLDELWYRSPSEGLIRHHATGGWLRVIVDRCCPEDALLALSTRWPMSDEVRDKLRLPAHTMALYPTRDYFGVEAQSARHSAWWGSVYRTTTFRVHWLGGQLILRGLPPLS